MSVVSLPLSRQQQASGRALTPCIGALQTSVGRIRLTVFRDFKSIEHQWRAVQGRGICAQAQTFASAEAWFRLVSEPTGAEPAVVCGHAESGGLQFVWPFEVTNVRGTPCLSWIGAEHAESNMGCYSPGFARDVSPDDMRALLNHAAKLIGVSVARFDKQPFERDGVPNPMALLPHQPCANDGHVILLDQDFETLFRTQLGGRSRNALRRKEWHLRDKWDVQIGWAETPTERRALMEELLRQKSRQFTELGVSDPFADGTRRAFFHELTSWPSGHPGTMEIGYVRADDRYVAISCGIQFKDRFASLLTAIHDGPARKYSPGTILLHRLIEDACRKGLNFFDMGPGDAEHMSAWFNIDEPLFESTITFDKSGHIDPPKTASTGGAKRSVKTRPALWSFAQTVRRNLYGSSMGQLGR